MSAFRQLTDAVFASPQLTPEDVKAAKDLGVTLIINNRPDGEDPSAPQGDEIASAAAQAGIDYLAIPVGHSGFSWPQVDAMAQALQDAQGKVLAYCRSGTRSTMLWAMARAKLGDQPAAIAAAADQAGYSVEPVLASIEMLAKQRSE